MITLIKTSITAKLKTNLITVSIPRFDKQFKLQAIPEHKRIKAEILETSKAALLKSSPLTAKVVLTYKIDAGVEVASVLYSFTSNDLVDNKLRRTHGFNQPIVDVSVIDNVGKEVMVGAEMINNNIIELDFKRVSIVGVWTVLIEK